ncbi:MAG: hypothetical protein B7X90_17395 [Novosphingobium sp. 17-62-19]|uniref:DUF3768 domain-containing protein n=1 Tax=Novosphingobium sp. 17-62-19 TaxID=1970406 RepID=UPI000BD6F1C1|nr:DUF3768 domain-containing protein [Novosphingobium sp. 17-62-19]OYX95388.1 MAG: hypothetical protein B7Y74_04410 [Novosphingobium sp. 35-62-5]OZA16710.1 MAG: hypothetical protein B7X90_17395 [Novosphingobium sp. 17-62-19]OZA86765.1 MAG: hypothetical protein B7X76_05065 [Azorhizobium sp. 39-67-5]
MSNTSSYPSSDRLQRERTERVAHLNDEVRRGNDPRARILFTRGVVDLLAESETTETARHARVAINQRLLMQQIVGAAIEPGDDPYGERDFGVVKFLDERIFWKIDSYAADGTFSFGSDAPWDASATTRVLTILLPSEY